MNFRRICACLCALCVLGCSADCGIYAENGVLEAYAESSDTAQTVYFTAKGEVKQIVYSGTTEVPVWYSDNTNVATVDSEGRITAVANGTAKVYAVFSSQVIEVTVVVEINDSPVEVEAGSVELSNLNPVAIASLNGVEASQAVWSSSDTAVAVVDSSGTITAVGAGQCTVTATVGNTIYKIAVTSTYIEGETPEVSIGTATLSNTKTTTKIVLTGVPEGATVVWSSSDTSVAVVDQSGNVKAVNSGECKIIANISGVNYVTTLTSTYDPNIAPEEVELGELTLTNENSSSAITLSGVPEGTVIEWSSSDTSVATVDENGNVTAKGSGQCKIYALINGVNYVMNVTSTYTEAEISAESTEIIGIGKSIQLGIENSDETAEWISTNVNVATVDENGVVTSVGEGETVIIAKLSGKVLSITVTVKAGVVYGDADLDGSVTIADVVLVMSYASNKEKNPITEQGADNADVYQRGDGISVSDALSIQKKLAQVITELPES